VRDGVTGLLFPADDVAALTSCLARIMADPARRAELAAQGRAFVEAERTWDSVIDRYAEIYERIGVRF
jgi:glycosyltransferase involved in cell wall biosynthesis